MKSTRNNIRFAGIGVMLLLGTGLVPAETLHVIALSGQPVPGGGGVFSGNGVIGMAAPALNNRGVVSFAGAIDGAVPAGTGYAVFCGIPGTVAIVARAGQAPAALAGSQFGLSPGFSNVAINDAGSAAFGAGLSPGNFQRGILRSGASPSAMTLHARTGLAGPWEGTLSYNLTTHWVPTINGIGQTAFYSPLSGTDGGSSDNSTILRGEAAGGPTVIAQKGDTLPAGGETFELYSSVPALNDAGQVAFLVTTSLDSNARAVLRGDGGSLTLMARTGTFVPGLGTIYAVTQTSEVAICDDGDVILRVNAWEGVNFSDGIIRADGSGPPALIVRVGDAVANYPGTFRTFDRHVAANGAGLVAFSGVITKSISGTAHAIFRGTSAVVVQGDVIPGGGATFLGMDGEAVAINDAGQIAFVASLSDGKRGIYFSDPEESLQAVAVTGQPFSGSTFSTLEFAATSRANGVLGMDRNGFNDAGEVAFRFELADGREGIALWSSLPKPLLGSASIAPVAGGFRVKFPGIPGWSYQVERDEDLLAPWEIIPAPIQADPAGWVIFDDLGPGLPARRFYRCFEAP